MFPDPFSLSLPCLIYLFKTFPYQQPALSKKIHRGLVVPAFPKTGSNSLIAYDIFLKIPGKPSVLHFLKLTGLGTT